MTITREIPKLQWSQYFNTFSKHLPASNVDVLVEGSDFIQIETNKASLKGISYDGNDDAIDIFIEGLDHRIASPSAVFVQEDGGKLSSVEVVDANGGKQVLRLTALLALPSA